MRRAWRTIASRSSLLLLGLVAGCDLAPRHVRPIAPVPDRWPAGPAYPAATAGDPSLPWRAVMTDPRLRTMIARALADNRNLQATVANVAAVRAQFDVQRSNALPAIVGSAGASVRRGVTTAATDRSSYDASVGISSFELDLFGRQKNLSGQAFERYLASAAGLRSARLALVAATASAYVTLAADRDMLLIAQDTLKSGERSLQLTRSLTDAGLAPMVDVANAQTTIAQAKSDIERDTTIVAQDENALALLAGGPVEPALLPQSLGELDPAILVVPAGLSSTILLQRPDVVQAEHQLVGAEDAIGAARAAFFPRITLTAAVGVASSALTSLFSGGALALTGAPAATLPVIGGPDRGNLAYAQALRDYYLAQYRYTVQAAFRDVGNGLARRGTIGRQRQDQADLVAASERAYRAADQQYRAGINTFLNALIAQRSLYAVRQTQSAVVLQDLLNRIALYEYIGADPSL